jgi:hypothetical protein
MDAGGVMGNIRNAFERWGMTLNELGESLGDRGPTATKQAWFLLYRTSDRRISTVLARTWNAQKTQPPVIAGVRSMARVSYWLQMTCYAQMADNLLLVRRGTGRYRETAFRMAGDDYGRTCYGREAFQDIAKTG